MVTAVPPVKIKIAWIGKTKEPAIAALTEEYLKRISRYCPVEGLPLRDEAALLALCSSGNKSNGRTGDEATRTAQWCLIHRMPE